MKYRVQVIRSNRKSLCIQINGEGDVIVRAPYRVSENRIREFVEEKADWIKKNVNQALERKAAREEEAPKFTKEELADLKKQAAVKIGSYLDYYGRLMRVSYGNVTIRSQRTRWGSCSRNGNLNFNCLLMLVPDEVMQYVVVHELCHRKEMNHSPRFWKEVERVLPDYKQYRKWLKDHERELIDRL